MLSRADDYPIHQLPEPIATAGTDRNFYDRYFFNGYTPHGSVYFALAFGVYPHLNVMDAAFSLIVDGVSQDDSPLQIGRGPARCQGLAEKA